MEGEGRGGERLTHYTFESRLPARQLCPGSRPRTRPRPDAHITVGTIERAEGWFLRPGWGCVIANAHFQILMDRIVMPDKFPFTSTTSRTIQFSLFIFVLFFCFAAALLFNGNTSKLFIYVVSVLFFSLGVCLLALGVGMLKPSLAHYHENHCYLIPTKSGVAKTKIRFWLIFNVAIYAGSGLLLVFCGLATLSLF